MSEEEQIVADFMKEEKLDAQNKPLFTKFMSHLKKQGKFIANGDVKKEFLEKRTVDAKGGEKIIVECCSVCGATQYEVKD